MPLTLHASGPWNWGRITENRVTPGSPPFRGSIHSFLILGTMRVSFPKDVTKIIQSV